LVPFLRVATEPRALVVQVDRLHARIGRWRHTWRRGAGHVENRELALILGQLPVLPKHWWESRDFTRPILEAPLGSGPYRIERFDAGRSIVYRRVADWWAKS
jgi:hypothetical protein